MGTVWTILKVLAGVAIISQPIVMLIIVKRMQRKHADLPNISVEDLKVLATKQSLLHCIKVIEELKSRNEDFSFALPLLLKLAVQRNPAAYLIGWSGLKKHFTEQLPEVDFSKTRATPEDRHLMQSKLNEIEMSTI